MSKIIDRMARAAYERNRSTIPEDKRPPAWEDETDHLREHWRANQRDGLAAAREPEDEEVINAGWVAALNQNSPNAMFDAWQAMIDEILK